MVGESARRSAQGAPRFPGPVGATADLLAKLTPGVEAEVKSRLGGLFGGFVRAYLPQTWVFRTDQDTATLTVDPQGNAHVAPTDHPSPDVTVQGPFAALRAAVESRGRTAAPRDAVQVTPHTAKGRAAFDYLRPRFGL